MIFAMQAACIAISPSSRIAIGSAPALRRICRNSIARSSRSRNGGAGADRIVRLAALALFALALLGAAAPAVIIVSPADISAENARWTSLGVHLPQSGIVLQRPYRAPYSTHSFVVPWSWYDRFDTEYRARHDFPVAASAIRADLPVLQLLMQKTYAGYAPAAQRGWNWDAWFSRWDMQLQVARKCDTDARAGICAMGQLEKFQLDNHSGVPSMTAFTSGSVSAESRKPSAGARARAHRE